MRFEEFAAARLPAVLRFAGVLTADRALAEDVVQEVLIRASKGWDRIGQLDRPELYVRKMVVNEYLSWRRRSWRLLPSGSSTEVDDRVTPDHAGQLAERDALLCEIGKLPRRQRAVRPEREVAASGPASTAAVRAKVLAAFSAAGGDIVYVSSTSLNPYACASVTQSWTYPTQITPGQLVRSRSLTSNRSGTLHFDVEDTFVEPGPAGTSNTVGVILAKGEELIVDYAAKIWSDQKDIAIYDTNPDQSRVITDYIKSGQWTVCRTTLNGRAALELTWRNPYPHNIASRHLWVDAATYLPLRETSASGWAGVGETDNYQYLPATAANLAKLTVPVPAGFKPVSGSALPKHVVPREIPLPPSVSPSPR